MGEGGIASPRAEIFGVTGVVVDMMPTRLHDGKGERRGGEKAGDVVGNWRGKRERGSGDGVGEGEPPRV
jgi:hypothetical protein